MAKTSLKSSMKIPWRRTLLVACLIGVLCLCALVEGADKSDDKADDKSDEKKSEDKKSDEKSDDKKSDEKTDDKTDDKKSDEKADDKSDDKKSDDKSDDKGDQEYDEFGDPKTPGSESSLFGGSDSGDGDGKGGPPEIPKSVQTCDGIYISYNFMGREKEYPHVKNATAQSWAFKAQAGLINMGATELKSWKLFIGFHHRELLVSLDGAVLAEGDDFPAAVGVKGTTIAGYPQADLKTAIQTAGDFNQMSVTVGIKGTMFGVKPPATPMPKTIKLENEGFKCPLDCTSWFKSILNLQAFMFSMTLYLETFKSSSNS